MATEERPERNKQCDDEEDDGCGRDYYDGEGIPVHVLDSGVEIKLPSIPQHYYGVKANGEHCRYPICEEREETIDELPEGVHRGPPGYLREVWDYARKAAYQARAKAAETALAHAQERELKLQLYFLNLSMGAWRQKAIHLMQCTMCFGNSAATATTTPAIVSLPNPPSMMPPAAAGTVNPMPELMQANAPTCSHIAPVEAPSSAATPHPLPSSKANGADASVAAAATPLENGTMSSLHNPTTTDGMLTAVSSIPQLPPPELKGKGTNSKSKSKAKAVAKNKATKTPTPKKNNNRKVGEKSKSTGVSGDGGDSWSLGLIWNAPKKRRT